MASNIYIIEIKIKNISKIDKTYPAEMEEAADTGPERPSAGRPRDGVVVLLVVNAAGVEVGGDRKAIVGPSTAAPSTNLNHNAAIILSVCG